MFSRIAPTVHAKSALRCHTLLNGVWSPASCHTERAKSQKYTGWPFVMKNASPSTRSVSRGMLGRRLWVWSSAIVARTCPYATFSTYVKSNMLLFSPTWNLVFPVLYALTILGSSCTSPSPKIPAGRMAQVRKLGSFSGLRLAWRTAVSAYA